MKKITLTLAALMLPGIMVTQAQVGSVKDVTFDFSNPDSFTANPALSFVRETGSAAKNDCANLFVVATEGTGDEKTYSIESQTTLSADGIIIKAETTLSKWQKSNAPRIYRQNAYESGDDDAALVTNPWAQTQLRAYGSAESTLNFTAPAGFVITKIEFTPLGAGYQNDLEEVVATGATAQGAFTAGTQSNPSTWTASGETTDNLTLKVLATGKKQVRLKTIQFTIKQVSEPFVEEALYLAGTMQSGDIWTPGDPEWKFSTTDNVVYTMEGKSIAAGRVFKITGSNWGEPSYSTSNRTMEMGEYDCPVAEGGDTNMGFRAAVRNLKIVFNKDTKKVVFSGDIDAPLSDIPESLFIIGEVSGNIWSPSQGVSMEKNGNIFTANISVASATAESPASFSFVRNLAIDWDALNIPGNRFAPAADVVMTLKQPEGFASITNPDDAKAFQIAENGQYTITADFNTMTATLTNQIPEHPEIPETLFVIGEVNGNSWEPNGGVEMVKDGNKFSVPVTISEAPRYFSFAVALAETWDLLNEPYNRYAPTVDKEISVGQGETFEALLNGDDAKAFFINTNGDYILTADFDTMTASVTNGSGIEIAIDDNADDKWFTLQGVRVNEPQAGQVYIRIRNNKAVKIIR